MDQIMFKLFFNDNKNTIQFMDLAIILLVMENIYNNDVMWSEWLICYISYFIYLVKF